MSDAVLVTGALGLVGSATLRQLVADGRPVVATDLPTELNRKKAASLPAAAQVKWADLTQPAEVDALLAEVAPAAIIHLAAVIPPTIYRMAALARKVNVDATATLVRAAEEQPRPPRFVQASSNAVYGSRNPHRHADRVSVATPPRATDLYGGHKLEAEELVRASSLEWVVLRLGGVLSADPNAIPFNKDALFFESALPSDGRMHSVDVRDVARAFANATTADVAGEILLIAGDESHLHRQGDVGPALAGARGLGKALSGGRPGNPDSDDDWFVTDWMDATRAQEALAFQKHSWPDMIAEMRAHVGWKRHLMRLLTPLVGAYAKRQSANRDSPGPYADPWGAIRRQIGEPGLDKAR